MADNMDNDELAQIIYKALVRALADTELNANIKKAMNSISKQQEMSAKNLEDIKRISKESFKSNKEMAKKVADAVTRNTKNGQGNLDPKKVPGLQQALSNQDKKYRRDFSSKRLDKLSSRSEEFYKKVQDITKDLVKSNSSIKESLSILRKQQEKTTKYALELSDLSKDSKDLADIFQDIAKSTKKSTHGLLKQTLSLENEAGWLDNINETQKQLGSKIKKSSLGLLRSTSKRESETSSIEDRNSIGSEKANQQSFIKDFIKALGASGFVKKLGSDLIRGSMLLIASRLHNSGHPYLSKAAVLGAYADPTELLIGAWGLSNASKFLGNGVRGTSKLIGRGAGLVGNFTNNRLARGMFSWGAKGMEDEAALMKATSNVLPITGKVSDLLKIGAKTGMFGKVLGGLGKASGIFSVLDSGYNLFKGTKDTLSSDSKTSLQGKLRLLGMATGGTVGAVAGGPVGAALGASLGAQLVTSKKIQNILSKLFEWIKSPSSWSGLWDSLVSKFTRLSNIFNFGNIPGVNENNGTSGGIAGSGKLMGLKKGMNNVGNYLAGAKNEHAYDNLIAFYADKYKVPRGIVKSVIAHESRFNPNALSPVGAGGLMQLMPATAKHLGVRNVYDPKQNIEAGTRMLKNNLIHFHGDVAKAVGAYNAGIGGVEEHDAIHKYKETRNYVALVKKDIPRYQKEVDNAYNVSTVNGAIRKKANVIPMTVIHHNQPSKIGSAINKVKKTVSGVIAHPDESNVDKSTGYVSMASKKAETLGGGARSNDDPTGIKAFVSALNTAGTMLS